MVRTLIRRDGHRLTILTCALALLVTSGCAVMRQVQPDPPRVTVAGVRPLNLSLTEQRLEFRLRVENPNGFDLPLRELDFVANVAGDRIASGRSNERVTIPANGEAIVKVDVTAGVSTLLGRLRQMLDDKTLELDYGVTGFVRLDNWPKRIPFDVEGLLPNPQGDHEENGQGEPGGDLDDVPPDG